MAKPVEVSRQLFDDQDQADDYGRQLRDEIITRRAVQSFAVEVRQVDERAWGVILFRYDSER